MSNKGGRCIAGINVEAIKKAMNDEKMNQAELARRIGVSRSCINRILQGQRKPGEKVIAGLKLAFPSYSLDYFFYTSVTHECHQIVSHED